MQTDNTGNNEQPVETQAQSSSGWWTPGRQFVVGMVVGIVGMAGVFAGTVLSHGHIHWVTRIAMGIMGAGGSLCLVGLMTALARVAKKSRGL